MNYKYITKEIIVKESIINFRINDFVSLEDEKGQVDKIVGTDILVRFANNTKRMIHYSRLNIISRSRKQSDYKKWSKEEEDMLMSGKRPKELSKELGRNIQSIYNKMKALGITIKIK